MSVRFVMVGGFLGAGKTTAIARLARHYRAQGRRIGVVTNDQAHDLVDTNALRAQGLSVEEVPGACFCCRFDDLVGRVGLLQAAGAQRSEQGEARGGGEGGEGTTNAGGGCHGSSRLRAKCQAPAKRTGRFRGAEPRVPRSRGTPACRWLPAHRFAGEKRPRRVTRKPATPPRYRARPSVRTRGVGRAPPGTSGGHSPAAGRLSPG